MTKLEKMNAICFFLINHCREANAEKMKINQEGVYHKGENIGDWEIVVRKKKPKK